MNQLGQHEQANAAASIAQHRNIETSLLSSSAAIIYYDNNTLKVPESHIKQPRRIEEAEVRKRVEAVAINLYDIRQ